jgi:hypothetical protein
MKIDSVDFFYLSMPVVTEAADGSQDALLVRVTAGGHQGWGECEAAPLPSIAAFVAPMSHGACRPVSDAAIFHEMLGHEPVMRRLAARGPDRSRAGAERPVGAISGAVERLLEKRNAVPLHRVQPQGGGLDVLAENLTPVDQEDAFAAEPLARRLDMEDIVGERLAEGRPAEFPRPESSAPDVGGASPRLLRRRAE